ncbi:MAG: protease modulator HflC [Dehalococcoidia bacterium]|nr:protease modulator HflC [Dehalococcoidia bacterium]
MGFRIFLVLLVAAGLVVLQSLYIVDISEQVIVTQFGQFKQTVREPGLHVKMPVVEQVTTFSRRILRYEMQPTSLLTSDKKNLVIDAYARYRIVDPLIVFQTVGNEAGADARLGSIISSELRKNVASHPQSDIIATARARLMATVAANAAAEAAKFGLELTDVRIKRADFPSEIAASVFERMRAERNREATQFRAEGSEEEIKIKADADRRRTILVAEARKAAEIIRGEGEAEAVRIYAQAVQQDPDFFAFLRSLEAYKLILKDRTTVVFSEGSELFQFLSAVGRAGVTP